MPTIHPNINIIWLSPRIVLRVVLRAALRVALIYLALAHTETKMLTLRYCYL